MSDTTETAVRRLRQDSPAVDAVCRQIQGHVDPSEADLAVDFAEIFFSKAPEQLLQERSTDALTHMALGALRFLQSSRPGQVDVSVLNPDVENEGWYAPVTVLRSNISERPFIVDTIREFLHARELAVEHLVYPVLHVARDEEGRVTGVGPSGQGGARESLVHCEVVQVTDPATLGQIEADVHRALDDVVRATDDFTAMIDAVNEVVAELAERAKALYDWREEVQEIEAFLRWLRDGAFVFLGYRAYELVDGEQGRSVVVQAGSGLGVLRDESRSSFHHPVLLADLDPGMRDLVEHGPMLAISKTNAESTVHRRVRMDYIGVKKIGPEGEVVGEYRFQGLFTSKAFSEDAESIPILRRKLVWILDQAGAREGSHDYKEIITIFNSLPKEELFLASAEEIGEDIRTVLTSYNTADVRVTLREDSLHRGISVMVILPKERFSGDVRRSIERALVDLFEGEALNYHLSLGGGDQARLHFYLRASEERLQQVDASEVEKLVARLIRTWEDRVREGLEGVRPLDEARRLARRYADAMSAEYQAATDAAVAVEDILTLEAMHAEDRTISIALANHGGSIAAPGGAIVTELKLFLRGERLVLSDFMPFLEDAGLRVIAVSPFEVGNGGREPATIYVFAVQDADGAPVDIDQCGDLLAETILAVRAGEGVSDSLNRLVVSAGLHWREVSVLRAYAAYAFQIGAVPSRLSLSAALVKYPGIARELFELFRVRFDPAEDASLEERESAAEDVRQAFRGSLSGVSLLSDDRALRRLEELISATLRTNYFRHGGPVPSFHSGGVPYISFKFSCAKVEFLRRSRLLYEVWVHSARMEGVHLRGARVARGGIRWSDRPDDFRTEILGLVKTQMVKNAVIVPGGSKGGFITRRVLSDPEARLQEGKDQYATLMRGLLDLTDNLDGAGRPVPPQGVVCFDEPDPYLVVAADKGTATFSDLANGVSAEYGFWLGDAFASGGSHGYDHKVVGITARGAWEGVKRHFRELGKDIQSEPFTVVGIGDMSGDVFGNGMLLSREIRLIAAFDHRHIFIDPDPDPAASFAERERMFGLERSSWDDYDRDALSAGGTIVPRATKEVDLTPEALSALGLPADTGTLSGEDLIRAVLRAPVDLLWNGGIGTYVKSPAETHHEAGDPTNDAVRVDVTELRCAVVGEGGNLGFTQRARVEYALQGGRINTDAMDNSGGVDMSDHEVNLKILLAPAVAAGRMSDEGRNELLQEMTDAVADLVLEDNRTQSLAISLDAMRAAEAADDFRDLMFSLEKSGELDRAAESLPSLDVLVERRERGDALTRPELCVLLAYAKLSVKSRLLHSGLLDDPVTEGYLLGYFPAAAEAGAGKGDLKGHRLRREIIASQLANDLVDLMGATFVNRLVRDTGRSAEEVVRAWIVASRLAGHRALLKQMGAHESGLPTRVSYRWLLGLARVLERTTRWVLQNVEASEEPAHVVDDKLEGLAILRQRFSDVVAGEDRGLFEDRLREIHELGADDDFSRDLITLRFLDQLLEIVQIARETKSPEVETGQAYYAVSAAFEIPWLRWATFAAAHDDQWEQRAAQLLSEDLSRAHRKTVEAVMSARNGHADVDDATRAVLQPQARYVEHFKDVLAELKGDESVGLAAVSVAIRELGGMADRLAEA